MAGMQRSCIHLLLAIGETRGDDGYFVTWSRLAPEKRIDLIVEAFTELDERLIVAGDGEQRKNSSVWHEAITISRYGDSLRISNRWLLNTTAVVYAPKDEDFGMVGAEAMMAGKPLLGVNEGFTKYQIEPDVTGELFAPTIGSLRDTVLRFNSSTFHKERIQELADRYDYKEFECDIVELIERTLDE